MSSKGAIVLDRRPVDLQSVRSMRVVYLSLAAMLFALAVLGAFLPVLPTTPFLLLTSWCLVRSSPKWHARLRRAPVFGPLLLDWERHRGVRLQVKLTAVTVVVLVVILGLWLGGLSLPMQVLLCTLAAVGLWIVLRLPTVREP